VQDGDDGRTDAVKDCCRCGGRAFYWDAAIIPGDPLAPRGSHRGTAHYQPAWTCINCGHVEPQERRGRAHSSLAAPHRRV
jgi:hypothetical protein